MSDFLGKIKQSLNGGDLAEAIARRAAPPPKQSVVEWAEGNLHINVLGAGEHAARITDVVLQGAINLDGTISAEHGIGVAKAVWLERLKGPSTMAALRSVKRALDPSGVFNPGVLLPA